MARRCFEATGARGLFVSVDEQGLDTSRLPLDRGVKLAYVTPSHQFPLGGTLPMARRETLLAWARRQGAWIVEDDYDGEFRYGQRPIDALASIDSDGRVIYVGTFSKALSPQLRLGYLVLPPRLGGCVPPSQAAHGPARPVARAARHGHADRQRRLRASCAAEPALERASTRGAFRRNRTSPAQRHAGPGCGRGCT